MFKILLLSSILAIGVNSALTAEKVASLPDLPSLDFGFYSGYLLTAGKTRQLHYTGCLSKAKGPRDPVIIYLTGNLGCSSILYMGALTGPFLFDPIQ